MIFKKLDNKDIEKEEKLAILKEYKMLVSSLNRELKTYGNILSLDVYNKVYNDEVKQRRLKMR